MLLDTGATITGGTMTVEGCGSESLQGDVRFAEVMGLMGADVRWSPYSITITGDHQSTGCSTYTSEDQHSGSGWFRILL